MGQCENPFSSSTDQFNGALITGSIGRYEELKGVTVKTSIAAAGVVTAIVGISILAVPAVASGAEYLATTDVAPISQPSESDSSAAAYPQPSGDLTGLITAWGVGGLIVLGGGATAVAASVRRQRKLTV